MIVYIAATVFIIFIMLFKLFKSKSRPYDLHNASVMIVAGSGGHTAEILRLVSALGTHFTPRIYVVATTDTTSCSKITTLEEQKQSVPGDYFITRIPRSRKVHQSFFTSVFTTLYSSMFSLSVLMKWNPDIVLCNGPGTCVPLCLIASILKTIRILHTRIIYVESICRVKSLSLSGKILYYFVDHLIVQWPELRQHYKKAIYLGRIS